MDALQKLLFERCAVRGETVALGEEFRRAVEHQNLPVAVRRLAGEVTAAALLSAAALEFDGTVLLQIAGDGPVKLIVAEVRKDLLFRVSVTMRDDAGEIAPNAGMTELVNRTGAGRCALILDMPGRREGEQPYQGIVSLAGKTFAEAMTGYFESSEQVPTKMVLAADDEAVGGIMIQKMPSAGGKALPKNFDAEGWDRLQMFVGSVKSEELLTLPPAEVNRRLFWEESPRVTYEAKPVFKCRCSDEGVRGMIRSLGEKEAEAIVAEQGCIEVTCHFCGKKRRFDAADVKSLFAKTGADKPANA
jgi:molecular chaperone Hsp33